MAERLTFKSWLVDFLCKLLPVVTGIAITFTLQGIVNRAHDRMAVRSAMELVRTELATNLEDIAVLDEYFQQEQKSAKYLSDHKKVLKKCPVDSVNFHTGIVRADVSVALSHDALELLKMSSLFPKIGDNDLSMKIIRAYDACELMVSNVSRHISQRDAQGDKAVDWVLARREDSSYITDPSDLKEALVAIDHFLSL